MCGFLNSSAEAFEVKLLGGISSARLRGTALSEVGEQGIAGGSVQ